ncbi:SURF1 domain-containing protein, partial [Cephalotus follicularis]
MAPTLILRTLTSLRGCGAGGGGAHSFLRKHCVPHSSFSSSVPAISSVLQSQSPSQAEKGRRSIWSTCWLFLPGAITFGLGTWQIFRRQDKVKMLEYRQKRLQMEPIRLNDIYSSLEKSESLEFRRVVCIGVFDKDRSIYVGPRSRSISGVAVNGYYVITPLMPVPNNPDSVQSTVLVNRGWVPRDWKDKPLEIPHDSQQHADIASLSVQYGEQSTWWRFWSKKPKIVE